MSGWPEKLADAASPVASVKSLAAAPGTAPGGSAGGPQTPQSAPPTAAVFASTTNPLSAGVAKLRDVTSAAVSTVLESASNLGNSAGGANAESAALSAEMLPNEYRNLLISLSGQKSDHILWIECLKQYHWEGDRFSEFDFALDKFGVPKLKNGDYTLNLCHDCLDLVVAHQTADGDEDSGGRHGFSFVWEGNYWDSRRSLADDFAHLGAASIAVVVNKCANILNELFAAASPTAPNESPPGPPDPLSRKSSSSVSANAAPGPGPGPGSAARGRAILAYMPNVVQLFVVQMAAARVGAILTFVNASVHNNPEDLAKILELSGADTVFTVDGFFVGERLHETKRTLDAAIELLHSEPGSSHRIHSVIMVRHVGANPSIPPPTVERPAGRRPHYGIEVPFDPIRDRHWSNLMLEASEECPCEWMQSEDLLFHSIRRVVIETESPATPTESTGPVAAEGLAGFEAPPPVAGAKRSTAAPPPPPTRWQFESYTVGQIALLVRLIARTLRAASQTVPAATGPIWPLVDSDDLLFLSTIMAVPLAGFALLMCESPPTHPSPTRIFEIVEKHDVKQLLIAERYIRLLIRDDDFRDVCHPEGDPTWSSSSLEMLYMVSGSRRANDSDIKWLQARVPTARILHLCC